jgi:hypothetical protein
MEQRTFKDVSNHLNTNIYSHLETSGGQSSKLYYKVVNFFNTHFFNICGSLSQLFSCFGV